MVSTGIEHQSICLLLPAYHDVRHSDRCIMGIGIALNDSNVRSV